jgi:uncharacterized protein (DUF952 family)
MAAVKQAGEIYHLVTESDFRVLAGNGRYLPARFEQEGFIHCTGQPETLLVVADDYFSAVSEPVLVLVIDVARLSSEVKFEPPAPIAGGGTTHLKNNLLFPHIYGPLNLDAVTGIGVLQQAEGRYAWPEHFVPLKEFLKP